MVLSFWKNVQEPSGGIRFSLSGTPATAYTMSFKMLFRRKSSEKVSLISSNKRGDTNFPVEHGGISCWLLFCNSAYSEETCGTSEVTAWYSGDFSKIWSFRVSLQYLTATPKGNIENSFWQTLLHNMGKVDQRGFGIRFFNLIIVI